MSIPNIPNTISLENVFVSSKEEPITNNKEETFWGRAKYIATHITVEPLIFFYILPGMMANIATQNMNLEKACRINIGFNDSVCDALLKRNTSGYEEYHEEEVQQLLAKLLTIKTAIIGIVPTILIVFFGSWSDRHMRRKPIILIPIFCDILSGLGLLVCSIYFLELSLEYVVFFDCFPYALGGGWSCVNIGIYSYISGLSSEKDRTVRVGAVSMFQNIALTFGNIFGGVALKPLGFRGVYWTAGIIMTSCLIYGMFVIKDPKCVKSEDNTKEEKNFLKDFFDLEHVRNTVAICFKDGPNNRKWKVVVLMVATFVIIGPVHGELAVVYLYTRIKFGWNEVDYSMYNTLQFVVQISGSVFALSVFSKMLKLSDAMLGIVALMSKILACFVYSFAPSGLYFFAGCFVEIFHGTSHIALRSLMTKIVPPHELGQSNSVFGVCEALAPFAFGPLYATLYNYTLRVFPGGFFLVSACLYIITIPLFIWLYICDKEDEKSIKNIIVKQEEKPLMNTTELGKIESPINNGNDIGT